MSTSQPSTRHQAYIGAGVLLVGGLMAFGASSIPADAGYAGVGPNFLPWVVSVVLILCGSLLIWEARSGGYRHAEPGSGAPQGDWVSLAWVSAGVLANAALITRVGFILSCALCFVLAVRRGCGRGPGPVGAGVLDVHQAAGHQSARPDRHWLALSRSGSTP
jgi:putative tricarboxylic transport membrane protein